MTFLQEAHPRVVRIREGASETFHDVVRSVVVVPEYLSSGHVLDAELQPAAGGEIVRQTDGEGEAVSRAVVGALDVAGVDVVEGQPVVGRVAHGDFLVVGDVGHTDCTRH